MRFNKALLIGGIYMFIVHQAIAQSEQENLGKAINSSANELNPILSEDGMILYFTRQYHPDNLGGKKDGGDIWFSELQSDGSWSEAKNAGKPLNNQYANSIIGFSANGQTVYLHGHYLSNGAKPNTQGISVSKKTASGWTDPEPVNIPYYYSKSDHLSGTIHASGNIMIVTLQSYDTRGAEDLYVLFKKSDGSWTVPKNLGKEINTEYQEMTPYLAPDGKTLFFASNGYEGFGSRDIFMSIRLDNSWKRWSNPKNLGAGVNTEGTELFYFLPNNGNDAYLTSTQNSDGLGDISRVQIRTDKLQAIQEEDTFRRGTAEVIEVEKIPETAEVSEVKQIKIQGKILNKSSSAPVEARISYRLLQQDSTQFQNEITSDSEGKFSLTLKPDQAYELMVSADGFIKEKEKILLSNGASGEELQKEILLTPIEVGSTVSLEYVLFDRGTASMLPGSEENLNDVVDFLKENPNISIEVSGHTDNRGRPDLNLLLSQDRAKAVKEYIVSKGINAERITDKGYGGTKPIASNAIEEERKKNRRVEFTIIKR